MIRSAPKLSSLKRKSNRNDSLANVLMFFQENGFIDFMVLDNNNDGACERFSEDKRMRMSILQSGAETYHEVVCLWSAEVSVHPLTQVIIPIWRSVFDVGSLS